MKILGSLSGWASGVNWYKYGIILLFYLASIFGAYSYGKYSERLNAAQEIAEQVAKEKAAMEQEFAARVPDIQQRDVDATVFNEQVKRLGEELNEVIDKKLDRPECALSPDELQHFQELAAKTRQLD